MALTAKFWRRFGDFQRVNNAGSRPRMSLHIASGDNGSSAITALQDALTRIQDNSPRLVASFFFFPDADVDGPRWGPYFINESEHDDAAFGTTTERAVIKFQKQALLDVSGNRLDPDGKAGMKTLGKLDAMLAFLDNIAP